MLGHGVGTDGLGGLFQLCGFCEFIAPAIWEFQRLPLRGWDCLLPGVDCWLLEQGELGVLLSLGGLGRVLPGLSSALGRALPEALAGLF